MDYIAEHEILYKDSLTKQMERIAPGTVLNKSHLKELGDEKLPKALDLYATEDVAPVGAAAGRDARHRGWRGVP